MEKKAKKKKKESKRKFPVIFRAHWRRYTKPKSRTKLSVDLLSGPRGDKTAKDDFKEQTKRPKAYDAGTSKSKRPFEHGDEVIIKPELPDFSFDPSYSTITWCRDSHKAEFWMRPLLMGPLAKEAEPRYGQVSLFFGPLLIAEISINVIIKEQLSREERFVEDEKTNSAYQKIFLSYSRADSKIIEKIQEACKIFGVEYMRDVKNLPHRDKWWPATLKLIKEADVFLLFWSKVAKESPYVKREWRGALKQKKKNFIRLVCWEKPMPELPPELGKYVVLNA